MLEVFCLDVAKVDRDVACVAMVVHVCCKRMLTMFHMFFSDLCCKCVYLMLHMFHTYVASVLSGCYVYLQWFSSVSGVFCKCFGRMSQVFHLSSDVRCNCCIWMFSKVDQTDCCNCWRGVRGRDGGAHAAWGQVGRRRRVGPSDTRSATREQGASAGVCPDTSGR
jgi:hypothetical protein